MKKLTKAIGGLAVILGLAGGVKAEAQEVSNQRRTFREFYDEGKKEYPIGNYCNPEDKKEGLLFTWQSVKVPVREERLVPKEVWEKQIDERGNEFYRLRVVYEPHCIEREEVVGYEIVGKGKLCNGLEKGCKKIKDNVNEVRDDLGYPGMKVLGWGIGGIGYVFDKVGGCEQEAGRKMRNAGRKLRGKEPKYKGDGAIKYRAPGKLDRVHPNDYQWNVPSTGQPTFAPRYEDFPAAPMAPEDVITPVPEVPERISQPTYGPKLDTNGWRASRD